MNGNNKLTTQWPSPGGEGAEVIYALRNKKYYPDNEKGNAVRRAWVMMEPSNQMFIPKDRV